MRVIKFKNKLKTGGEPQNGKLFGKFRRKHSSKGYGTPDALITPIVQEKMAGIPKNEIVTSSIETEKRDDMGEKMETPIHEIEKEESEKRDEQDIDEPQSEKEEQKINSILPVLEEKESEPTSEHMICPLGGELEREQIVGKIESEEQVESDERREEVLIEEESKDKKNNETQLEPTANETTEIAEAILPLFDNNETQIEPTIDENLATAEATSPTFDNSETQIEPTTNESKVPAEATAPTFYDMLFSCGYIDILSETFRGLPQDTKQVQNEEDHIMVSDDSPMPEDCTGKIQEKDKQVVEMEIDEVVDAKNTKLKEATSTTGVHVSRKKINATTSLGSEEPLAQDIEDDKEEVTHAVSSKNVTAIANVFERRALEQKEKQKRINLRHL